MHGISEIFAHTAAHEERERTNLLLTIITVSLFIVITSFSLFINITKTSLFLTGNI